MVVKIERFENVVQGQRFLTQLVPEQQKVGHGRWEQRAMKRPAPFYYVVRGARSNGTAFGILFG